MRSIYKYKKEWENHLNAANEGYFQHLSFTVKMFIKIFVTSLTILIHGVFPCFFTKTTSKRLSEIDKTFQGRLKDLEEREGFFNI